MATSGSYNFLVNRNEIIKAALRAIRAVGSGIEPSADEVTDCAQVLNLMVKQWQGKSDFAPGLKVFSRQRVTLFLAKGQQTYLVGPASTDARATTQYGRTTIDAAEAGGQTIISVTATTDTTTYPGTTVTMTAADIIGVELDDGTIHWSTISSVAAGDTVTLANAIPSAAAVGNYVWWFTTRAQRLIHVEHAVLRDEDYIDSDLPMFHTVSQYESRADKGADGAPTTILVEPLRLNTRITLDSQPTDVTDVINLTGFYPTEDLDSATDDFSYPQEWFNALKWGLAKQVAPECGRGLWTEQHQNNYLEALALAQNVNPETSDVYFQPGLE